MSPPPTAVAAAIDAAASPGCPASRRGVAIFCKLGVVAVGRNARVSGPCDRDARCRLACAKICEHAEAAALRDLRSRPVLVLVLKLASWLGLRIEMLHVKVDGQLVVSGPPSCWQCSRAIALDDLVSTMWLYHEAGWRRYDAAEFHRLTLAAKDLPGGE